MTQKPCNPLAVTGYVNSWSAHSGQQLTFYVSCEADEYRVELRRLIHGDDNPSGPGVKEEVIAHPLNNQAFVGSIQKISTGSCMVVDELPQSSAVAITGAFQATLLKEEPQSLLCLHHGGRRLSVVVEAGALQLTVGPDEAEPTPGSRDDVIRQDLWYGFFLAMDHVSGEARFTYRPMAFTPVELTGQLLRADCPPPDAAPSSLVFAAAKAEHHGNQWRIRSPFNGRLADLALFTGADDVAMAEACWVARRACDMRPTALWDFVRDAGSDHVPDVIGDRHGHTINRPTRLVTGPTYGGQTENPFESPEFFNAAHFHEDDLSDAGWNASFTLQIDAAMRSGIYAARLTCAGGEDYIPFIVTPEPGCESARVAVLLPTLSYQIYANMQADASILPDDIVPLANKTDPLSPAEAYVRANKLSSCYDRHLDGSGVSMATLARPMPVFARPRSINRFNNGQHQLGADLHLIDWLEQMEIEYQVVTDHDLHARGASALSPFNVVLSGSHAEYWSGEMLDALMAYQEKGGRFIYLSGNGLYWVTALSADGQLAEVRREHGLRSWTAAPGEAFISLSSTRGGIWRNRGRAPQRYVGVGMTAMGFDVGRPYRRSPASYDSRAAFLFDGIDGELIGDFANLVSGYGAAGYEFDRADIAQGTPHHALVLATASGFSDNYQLVVDEVISTSPFFGGTHQPDVRADIVYYETRNGGAVFAASAITWCASLSYSGYRNTVSRLTENVVRHFMNDPDAAA